MWLCCTGPARVGWSKEADGYLARLGLVPPLARPASAQPTRDASGSGWVAPAAKAVERPASAPARVAATVVARWSHHRTGYALRGWREAALARQACRARVVYALKRWRYPLAYRALGRWWDQVMVQVGLTML